jgi:hypothetical protein
MPRFDMLLRAEACHTARAEFVFDERTGRDAHPTVGEARS